MGEGREEVEEMLATAPMFTDDGRPIKTLEDLQRYDDELRAASVCLDCGRTMLDHCHVHTFPCCTGECNIFIPAARPSSPLEDR